MADQRTLPDGNGHVVHLWAGTMTFRATSEARFVAELTAQSGFAPTPHVHHRHEELFYVLDGTFEFLVGDETMLLGPGSFVEVPPGVVHDFCNVGPSDGRLLGIVTPGGFDRYFREIEAHIRSGTFDEEALASLRERYDTTDVHLVWRSLGGTGRGTGRVLCT